MAKKNSNDRARSPSEAESDAAFASRMVATLPAETASAALEARILADFDAALVRRRFSPRFAAAKLAEGLRDLVWPSAPAWKPASVFALSLLLGLAAGVFVPATSTETDNSDQVQTVALDSAPSLDILGDL